MISLVNLVEIIGRYLVLKVFDNKYLTHKLIFKSFNFNFNEFMAQKNKNIIMTIT